MTELADARLRILVAPAGYGKTTLLQALRATPPADGEEYVSYTASIEDASPAVFVRKIAQALGPAVGTAGGRITRLETVLRRLRGADRRFTVFVDNAERLGGHPAAATFTRLVNEAPESVRFVVATRSATVPAVSKLAQPGAVHRFDHRDLRLRPWETEELFRDVYRRPLPPDAAALLCAQVEGWPAALHAFHMDTVRLSEHDRLSALRDPLGSSAQLRDYLTVSVLGRLPEDVRDFVVGASALGLLSASRCDALLERTDSARLLSRLADNQVLTWRCQQGDYRFHLLLQRYLENALAQRLGPRQLRDWYGRAAGELARHEHWAEAYRAYAHAEDWSASAEIAHHLQADHQDLSDSAILPRILLDADPWITLANARRHRADGRLAMAVDAYRLARTRFTDPRIRWRCATEQAAIECWFDHELSGPVPLQEGDLSSHLRQALHTHPARLLGHATRAADPDWSLARALAALFDGRMRLAAGLLVDSMGSSNQFVSLASRIVQATLAAVTNRPEGSALVFTSLALEAEAASLPWLARIARACGAISEPGSAAQARAVREECRAIDDRWGALVAGFALAVNAMRNGGPATAILRDTIGEAAALSAAVPELWLRALLVEQLSSVDEPDADTQSRLVALLAEQTGVRNAVIYGQAVAAVLRSTRPPGAAARQPAIDPAGSVVPVTDVVEINCLGEYRFVVHGQPVDLSGLRPQARLVLRMLSMHASTGVHEEKLIEAVWPGRAPALVRHRLHVAVSSLRRLLRGAAIGRGTVDITRRGASYSLRLPPGSTVDLADFDEAVQRWRTSAAGADREEAIAWGYRALQLYRGELLSEEGSAEWVLVERDRLRTEAATVATALATTEVAHGDIGSAIRVCQRGLQIDELNGRLWQLLAKAQHRSGNRAAARRALRTYQGLLAEPDQAM